MRKTSCEVHLDEIHARLATERTARTGPELDSFTFVPVDVCAFNQSISFRDAEAKADLYRAQFDPVEDKRYPPYELKLDIETLAALLECPTRMRGIDMARRNLATPTRKPMVQVKKQRSAGSSEEAS